MRGLTAGHPQTEPAPSSSLAAGQRSRARTGQETTMMFLDCPAYGDDEGITRCGLPAEVEYRYTVQSTDGPLESAKIRCPRGHWFNGPIQHLIAEERCTTPAARPPHQQPRAPAQKRVTAAATATHLTAGRSTTRARS
jgi:hypothetical protein